jgi:Ca2+-binding RTX toxin-like protein
VDSSAATLSVTNTAPTGAISGPSDVALGSSLSLSFTATDASPVDQAAGFDYTITWGDGATDGPLHSGSPLSRSHTFTLPGVYTVTMTATDKDGGTSTLASKTVTIRGVGTVPSVCGSGSDLVVGGTSGADTITISSAANGKVAVKINNVSFGSFVVTGRLLVYGQGGNDTITVDSKLTLARVIYGGDGNDTITGGNGTGVLVGGPGNDWLSGGNARDVLIGGTGADTLKGGNGDDLLVAGSTSYDSPSTANLRSLCKIQAEWLSSSSYSTRIAHLSGTASGGLNGSYLLKASGAGTTVFDDGVKDTLTGALGQDWFLLNRTGGVLDVSDATSSETRTDLS